MLLKALLLQALYRKTAHLFKVHYCRVVSMTPVGAQFSLAERDGMNHSQPYAEKTSAQGITRDVMLRATMNGKLRF